MKSVGNVNNILMHHIMNVSEASMPWKPVIRNNIRRMNISERNKVPEYSSEPSCKNVATSGKLKLYIKNMVSIRCKIVVKAVLDNLGLHYTNIELGEVEIAENLTQAKRDELKTVLLMFGLELLEDKKNILVERIKNIIIEMIHYSGKLPKTKFSNYLSEKLNHDYSYLSRLFSEVKGITIEHCIMSHKIERVKELIFYDELTLSEIAYKLDYSSVAHLSNQFKKITGLTPTNFREMKQKGFIALENL